MGAAFLIAWKDLRQRARDRSAFLIAFVVPLALAFIFSQILSDVGGDDITFEYAVVDEDGGASARAFADELLAPLVADGLLDLTESDSRDEGLRLVDDGTVSAAFVIPLGFSSAVESGQPAQFEVIGNVDRPIGTMVASSIATSFTNEIRAVQISVATVLAFGEGELTTADALIERASTVPNPISLEDVSGTRKELDAKTFFAAGMAVFFLFFTVQFGISSLLDERREGTLNRLLAAPIRRPSILVGKLITSFVLGIVSMVVLAVATSVLLGAEWGDPYGVALLIIVGVLAATAVMSLIATLARTAEQAGNYQAIVALVLGMLGGSFFPVGQAGGFIERLSLLTPHAWFLRGLGELQSGGGLNDIVPALGAILAFVAVTGAIAFLRQGKLIQQ